MSDPSRRLLSLDAFRGLTIAAMLLVNNPGRWSDAAIYPPLRHAVWNGCTPTDLIFPFFLFAVGVAIAFAFARRLEAGQSRRSLLGHAMRRSLALLLLGLFLARFPAMFHGPGPAAPRLPMGAGGVLLRAGLLLLLTSAVVLLAGVRRARPWWLAMAGGAALGLLGWFVAVPGEASRLAHHLVASRVPGVLQRIAVCYLAAAALELGRVRRRTLLLWMGGLLLLQTLLVLWVPVPGFGRPDPDMDLAAARSAGVASNWGIWLDTRMFGLRSLELSYDPATRSVPWAFDPEGLIGTPTALATVLLGLLAGRWLRRRIREGGGVRGAWIAAGIMTIAGLALHPVLPLNKQLWTGSYVLLTGGLALAALLVLHLLIETRGRRRWAVPFGWYGRNAILAFVGSGLAARLLVEIRVPASAESGAIRAPALKTWLFEHLYASWLPLRPASLLFALSVVLVWLAIAGWLHRRRCYLKL